MFGRIGAGELILILAIALVVFGPSKLPEVGKSLGKAINEFRNYSNKVSSELDITGEKAQAESVTESTEQKAESKG